LAAFTLFEFFVFLTYAAAVALIQLFVHDHQSPRAPTTMAATVSIIATAMAESRAPPLVPSASKANVTAPAPNPMSIPLLSALSQHLSYGPPGVRGTAQDTHAV
jgi:hypothetical protein